MTDAIVVDDLVLTLAHLDVKAHTILLETDSPLCFKLLFSNSPAVSLVSGCCRQELTCTHAGWLGCSSCGEDLFEGEDFKKTISYAPKDGELEAFCLAAITLYFDPLNAVLLAQPVAEEIHAFFTSVFSYA